tara:strand:+ start:1211 stop:1378 length:168 start_codon:yes stop_codon:yes gene_type:complete
MKDTEIIKQAMAIMGRLSAKKLTKEARSEKGRQAVKVRWSKAKNNLKIQNVDKSL